MKYTHLLLLCSLMLLCTCSVRAQMDRSMFLSSSADRVTISNYYFAKPNELTITVSVMGFVYRPGRYEISPSIDLVNLLALAGGATNEGNMNEVKVTRFSDNAGKISRTEYRIDLSNLSAVDPAQLALRPGDIVQIERAGWNIFREGLSAVVSAAIITSAVAQVIMAAKR